MPEDNNPAAGAGADQQPGAGENQPGAGDAGQGDGGADDQAGQDNAKAPDNQAPEDDNAEPPMRARMSKQDFIIGRQKAKIAKANKANQADESGDNEEDDYDSKVTPEDEDVISRVVAKKFAPIIDKSLADEDDREIADFLTENPDFKQFEAKARRFMQHPSRRQLPIKSIFYEVAGDALLKMGADRSRAADTKAKASQTGGGSSRGGENQKNDWELTPEEFQAKQEKIRRGQ